MRNRAFFFFSFDDAAGFVLLCGGVHDRQKRDRMDRLHPRRGIDADSDGQLLGTQRPIGDVPRSKEFCGVSGWRRSEQVRMLASSISSNYFSSAFCDHGDLVCKLLFHMTGWGNLWAVFLLSHLRFGGVFGVRPYRGQRDQHHAGNADDQPADLDGLSVSLWRERFRWQCSRLDSARSLFCRPPTLQRAWRQPPPTRPGSRNHHRCSRPAIGLLVAFEISRRLFRWEPEAKVVGRAKSWVLVAMVPFLVFGAWENVTGTRLQRIRTEYQTVSGRMLRQITPGQMSPSNR